MWNKALRALIVQMSVRETRLKPSREKHHETRGERWWWSGTTFQVVTWDGEVDLWVDVWRVFVGGFWGRFGGWMCFFCQPDNLGVNDSQFDYLDTFPKCVFVASRFLDSKWGGANFPWYHRMKWIQLPNLNVEAPHLLLVASEVSQKVTLFGYTFLVAGCEPGPFLGHSLLTSIKAKGWIQRDTSLIPHMWLKRINHLKGLSGFRSSCWETSNSKNFWWEKNASFGKPYGKKRRWIFPSPPVTWKILRFWLHRPGEPGLPWWTPVRRPSLGCPSDGFIPKSIYGFSQSSPSPTKRLATIGRIGNSLLHGSC